MRTLIFAAILVMAGPAVFAGDLSAHFSRFEFNQHGDPMPVDQIKVSPDLVDKLEKLRHIIGDRPIHICSGYRSPLYNMVVGGVPRSQHMLGKAADIMVDGMTAKELEPYAKAAGFTFTQTYPNHPHLHVDVR